MSNLSPSVPISSFLSNLIGSVVILKVDNSSSDRLIFGILLGFDSNLILVKTGKVCAVTIPKSDIDSDLVFKYVIKLTGEIECFNTNIMFSIGPISNMYDNDIVVISKGHSSTVSDGVNVVVVNNF